MTKANAACFDPTDLEDVRWVLEGVAQEGAVDHAEELQR